MPTRKTSFQLSYRSYNIVLPTSSGIEYWDKYGYAISPFQLPGAERTTEDCITVSQDGRVILYLDDTGVLRQMDVGKVLAQHLISASRIFMEELKRLGTVTPGAEENLQWAMESMNDGDVQYALSFGSQAYSSMEGTLDSLPTRKPSAEASRAAQLPAAALKPAVEQPVAQPPSNAVELYKKGLKDVFSVKAEPTEIEWNLLTILREAFKITAEEHDTYEEEVKAELRAAAPPVKAPPPGQVRATPQPAVLTRQVPTISYAPPVKPVSSAYVPKELEEEPETFEEAPPTPVVEEPRPAPKPAPAYEPPRVERSAPVVPPARIEPPASLAPSPEPPKAEEPPARAPEPARTAEPQAANITMDSYVSDILGKYLKK